MKRGLQRGVVVFVAAAAAGFATWRVNPGSPLDRFLFQTVAGSFDNGHLFVEGEGSHAKPWRYRAFATQVTADPQQAPVVVSVNDDHDHVFQESPPAPIDHAVMFSNFHRLGARKAAVAAVLAWDSPDAMGVAALEKTLSQFESLAMAAPLTRGAVAGTMPFAFRNSSIPISDVHGDVSKLPVVNRLAIPSALLSDRAMAGFSVLETESAPGTQPLLARWEDRVVFAFPLMVVLQREHIAPALVEVSLGEYLRLGKAGNLLPINEYGAFKLPQKKTAPYRVIAADALINGGDDLFPKQAPDPVILRDDQSAAEPATQAFSRDLAAMVAALASDSMLGEAQQLARLPKPWELGSLGACVMIMTLFSGLRKQPRRIMALVLGGVALTAMWMGVGMASVWLPGVACLAAVVAGVIAGSFIPEATIATAAAAPAAAPAPVTEPAIELFSPAEIPTETPAAKKAARKRANKSATKTPATPRKPEPKDLDAPKPPRKKRGKSSPPEAP